MPAGERKGDYGGIKAFRYALMMNYLILLTNL